jgi:hypothetical protein
MTARRRLLAGLATAAALAAAGPARAQDPVVVAFGDAVCGPDDPATFACRHAETADVAVGIAPDAVLALGDLQYPGGAFEHFMQFYDPTWGRLKAITYPVVGNHEYAQPGAAGYFDYFNGPGAFSGRAGDRDKGYYSFDLGAWHVVALNSNCDDVPGGCAAGSPQEQWLRADLAANPRRCTLAIQHHPRWASDQGSSRTPEVQPFIDALHAAHAELLLVGHDHDYERFAPSAPDQSVDPAGGLRQIIVGTGGRDVNGFGPAQPNSEVREGSTFGVLKVTLRADAYDWEFVPIAGSSFRDAGTTRCHDGAAAAPPPPARPQPGGPPPPPGGSVTALAPAGLRVTSAVVGRTRVVLRGRLASGASARRVRISLSRRTRRGTVRATASARAERGGRWRAVVRLPRRARGLRSFAVTVRFLGQSTHAARTVRLTARRPRG